MLVSQLQRHELASRLQGSGLTIRTGPFINRLRSSIPLVAEGVELLYADFPLADENEFVEYTVTINRMPGPTGWLFGRAFVLARGEQYRLFGWFSQRLGYSYLEWGLNYAIYGDYAPFLVLHGAVLERNGRALIILGDSGAGKSTLCGALALSGWRLLSDELGLVSLDDGLISPLARPVSLKDRSIDVIRKFAPQAVLSTPRHTSHKGLVAHLKPPTDSVQRMDERAEPAWIVLVKHAAGSPLTVNDVSQSHAFAEILRSGFNYPSLGELGFRQACQLVDRCRCRSVQYDQLSDVLAHFNSPAYQAG